MNETVGQRVKRLRLERNLTQRGLAAPGVGYAYISRIEAETRTPSVMALRKIAGRLGVTAEYLETGVDSLAIAEKALDQGLLDVARRAIRKARAREVINV